MKHRGQIIVARITGAPLEQVLEWFPNPDETMIHELADFLRSRGFEPALHMRQTGERPPLAIVRMIQLRDLRFRPKETRKRRGGHWVLLSGGVVWDPQPTPGYDRIGAWLAVLNRRLELAHRAQAWLASGRDFPTTAWHDGYRGYVERMMQWRSLEVKPYEIRATRSEFWLRACEEHACGLIARQLEAGELR